MSESKAKIAGLIDQLDKQEYADELPNNLLPKLKVSQASLSEQEASLGLMANEGWDGDPVASFEAVAQALSVASDLATKATSLLEVIQSFGAGED